MTLGIDIGGTTIGCALIEDGQIIHRTDGPSFPQDATVADTLRQLGDRIEAILEPGVTGIGIGVPTVVDAARGVVYDASNIPSWKEVPLKAWVEERFGLPAVIDNDANCYAWGAATRLHRQQEIVTGITLGTGVGVGIVSGGTILRGRCCGAGELCCLPYRGSVIEDFTSSKFFAAKGVNARELARRADAADPEALALFAEFGAHLAHLTATVLYAYDPHCVVFGGGIAHAFRHFEQPLREHLQALFFYKSNLRELHIEALPGDETALVGAASLR